MKKLILLLFITLTTMACQEEQKIAFVAPIATALLGAKIDQVIDFKLGNEIKRFHIDAIEYSYI